MTRATASSFAEDAAHGVVGHVGDFEIDDYSFAESHRIPAYDPPDPYVAVLLAGRMDKSFEAATHGLGAASVMTIPSGARHATRFGLAETRVILVKPAAALCPSALRELRHFQDGALTALGWRLAAELAAEDAAWPLAAEGIALELLAALSRRAAETPVRRPPTWFRDIVELLHEQARNDFSVADVAATVSVHPAHVARVFRRHTGSSIGSYVRRLRLEWAAAQLSTTDAAVGTVAADAGFADQSHFTRAFKRHTGLTPGNYRRLVRR
jgi:AraC family transcriptional regulator